MPRSAFRILAVSLAVISVVAVTACSSCQSQPTHARDLPPETPRVTATDHDAIAPHLRSITRFDSGVIQKGRLRHTVVIDGIPCRGWTWFNEDGTLHQSVLATNFEFFDFELPSGSTVFFDDEQRMESSWISKDVVIQGLPVNGGWGKIWTKFHPNGKLKTLWLSESTVIQNVPCAKSLLDPVIFREDGTIAGCQLSEDWKSGGETFEAGTEIRIAADGAVTVKE